jgi:hypothetical protein
MAVEQDDRTLFYIENPILCVITKAIVVWPFIIVNNDFSDKIKLQF